MSSERARKLRELTELKLKGKKRSAQYLDKASDLLYDEVDEETYKESIRKRIYDDDFVEDDNGAGYVDRGQEEFGPEDSEDSEEERDIKKKRSQAKSKPISKPGLLDRFVNQDANASSKASNTGKSINKSNKEQNDQFMQSLLADIEPSNDLVTESAKPVLRKGIEKKDCGKIVSDDDYDMTGEAKDIASLDLTNHAAPDRTDDDFEDLDLDDAMQDIDEKQEAKVSVPVKEEEKVPIKWDSDTISSQEKAPRTTQILIDMNDVQDFKSMNEDLADKDTDISQILHPTKPTEQQSVLDDDGNLRFFWIDFMEMNNVLYLIGKVYRKQTKSFVSCLLSVENILRTLYALPKTQDDDSSVPMTDVYAEITELMAKNGIKKWKAKPTKRKYCFELNDVPEEAEYLKILYPYANVVLPKVFESKSISRLFGTETTIFEQFTLLRKVMGPCWLKVKSPIPFKGGSRSWCQEDFRCEDIGFITPEENVDAPSVPFKVMSLAFRTAIVSKGSRNQEIVSISGRIFEDVSVDSPLPIEKMNSKSFAIVRPFDRLFPTHFEKEAASSGEKIICEKSESAMLSTFLSIMGNVDPDIIVGHQFEEISSPILLSRLRELRISNWHRMGRMKRSQWPSKMSGQSFQWSDRQIYVGRLICDLVNDFGRSTIQSQSWSLTEIVQTHLNEKRIDLDPLKAINSWAKTSKGLIRFITHCNNDTYYIAAVCFKMQMLPLSKNLTNLAGNSWARTLSGTRSERNEFILLHQFHRNKYICPDKQTASALKDSEEEENTKQSKYKGGLVFEPEKGMYTDFVLVMDFNSLYPSIIREYNICFTTVDRRNCKSLDDIPDIPPSHKPQGILPFLLANLVNRRKQVKNLLKDKNLPATQRMQLDIKQQALKLTANSMYGCLGFTKSRFYARPIAMLITFRGRQILNNTKDLASSLNLRVIYGDTDSLMIDTKSSKFAEALKMGEEFKNAVNKNYQYLEIDIDNVYQRLLLHAKKKYAALNYTETNGTVHTKIDVKGLDMRRREYCTLSKDASQFILDQILSGKNMDEAVHAIHEYLRDLGQKIKNNEIQLSKYIIYNALGKNPEDYPNGRTLPHVQVALRRKARGDLLRVHDVVAYVIIDSNEGTVADRARSPEEFDELQKSSNIQLDAKFYLTHQIMPPIERLCNPISETNKARLAECLGLDPSLYKVSEPDSIQDDVLIASDKDRFEDCKKLYIHYNGKSFEFSSINFETIDFNGFRDPEGYHIPYAVVYCQLYQEIMRHITLYYQAFVVCEDPACAWRTRQISVYGQRCLNPACRSTMHLEYTSRALLDQLMYLEFIFDAEKTLKYSELEDAYREKLKVLISHNRHILQGIQDLIRKFLSLSGQRTIDFKLLFCNYTPPSNNVKDEQVLN